MAKRRREEKEEGILSRCHPRVTRSLSQRTRCVFLFCRSSVVTARTTAWHLANDCHSAVLVPTHPRGLVPGPKVMAIALLARRSRGDSILRLGLRVKRRSSVTNKVASCCAPHIKACIQLQEPSPVVLVLMDIMTSRHAQAATALWEKTGTVTQDPWAQAKSSSLQAIIVANHHRWARTP
jgi:hypothetical protein